MTRTKSQKARARAARGSSNPFDGPGPRRRNKGKKKSGGRQFSTNPFDNPVNFGKVSSMGLSKTVQAPLASSRMSRNIGPVIQGNAAGTRVRHREWIGNINGSSTFSIAGFYPINPGIGFTFPWLSGIAILYEQYRFHRLRFVYVSRCAATVPGSFYMAPDYDAADPAAATEAIITSYDGCVDVVPWTTEAVLELDVSKMFSSGPKKFVRTQPLAPNLDVKTYDAGSVQFATVDGTNVNWGKVWVEYDVEFYTPTYAAQDYVSGYAALVNNSGVGVSTTVPLGTSVTQYGNLNMTVVGTTLYIYNLPTGTKFRVDWRICDQNSVKATATFPVAAGGCTANYVYSYNWATDLSAGSNVNASGYSGLQSVSYVCTSSPCAISCASSFSNLSIPTFASVEVIVNYGGIF